MPSYKLGRDAVATLPGLVNDDIKDVTVNVSAEELDVTVFGEAVLTDASFFAGLIDVTIDVVCTHHTATIGQVGAKTIAGLPSDLDAVVLNVSERVNPRGMVEFTVQYGLTPQDS